MSKKAHSSSHAPNQTPDGVVYTFPQRLLKELLLTLKIGPLDRQALVLEQQQASKLAKNPHWVGHDSAGSYISYSLLAPGSLANWDPSDKHLKLLGLTPAKFKMICQEGQARQAPYLTALSGYAGWLVTNPEFLAERDQLFTTWKTFVKKEGVPRSGPTTFGNLEHTTLARKVTNSGVVGFLKAFENFYARWRLQHLVTRELPQPLAPQIPLLTPLAPLTHMKTGGVTLYQPDTMPIPGRDRLIDVLTDVRHLQANDHLAGWLKLSRRDRSSDHSMQAVGQEFRLHHYWSILEQRHPTALERNVGRAQEAFGEFLGVDSATVDKYRQRIRRCLKVK